MRFPVLAALVLAACRGEQPDAYGNFEATEVTVAAEVGGRLLAFGLEEGDRIARDSVVGVVDTVPLVLERQGLVARRAAAAARTREAGSNIGALEVQRTIADRELARTERLLRQSAATAQQGDQAEQGARVVREQLAGARAAPVRRQQEVAAIEAQVAAIDDKLARSRVRSRSAAPCWPDTWKPGSSCRPASRCSSWPRLDSLTFRAYVSNAQLTQLALGQRGDGRRRPGG